MVASIHIKPNPVTTTTADTFNRTFVEGEFSGYSHDIQAMGGFMQCSFKVGGKEDYLLDTFKRILGFDVKAYSKNGGEAWHGFINTLTLQIDGFEFSATLDTMENKIWLRHATAADNTAVSGTVQKYDGELNARIGGAGQAKTRSTKYSNTESQTRYGIKEGVFDGGHVGLTAANKTAQGLLKTLGWPQTTIGNVDISETKADAKRPVLSISCKGYSETLKWQTYNQTALTGNYAASSQVADVITAKGDFIASTAIDTNATSIKRQVDADRNSYDIIMDCARVSDASFNRWIAGVLEDRILYYKQAPSTAIGAYEYVIEKQHGTVAIRSAQGATEPLALMRPGKWAKIPALTPFGTVAIQSESGSTATMLEDPSCFFIEGVIYTQPDRLTLVGSRTRMIDVMMVSASMGSAGVT